MDSFQEDTKISVIEALMPKDFCPEPKLTALVRAFRLNSVLVTKRNLIQIKFQLHHFQGMVEETRLLDTRATESFINHKTVARFCLGTQKLTVPRPVLMLIE